MPGNANRRQYEQRRLVRAHLEARELEPPEAAVLDLLRPRLAGMDMLDLGCGAGRTTLHFEPLVHSYVGLDYAGPQIEACLERFGPDTERRRFVHADARDLRQFEDASFDFVLFSVNGLDLLDHGDRLRSLAEIARVMRDGGSFFCSTHNLEAVERAISIRAFLFDTVRASPLRRVGAIAKRVPARVLQRLVNPAPARLAERAHAIVGKGWPPRSPAWTYHCSLDESVAQLEVAGFEVEEILLPGGAPLVDRPAERGTALWLNFLCRRRARADGVA